MSYERVVGLLDVSKAFGTVQAVDRISLEIQRGQFVSLLGPSGCGKTTTLRLIAGFEFPDAGEIQISGRDVAGVPAYRRPVNTVFQNYALFPHLNVFDNVAFGLRRHRVAKAEIRKRVHEFLGLVRLEGLGGRYPTQLSGGQQQRVALARALANRPEVLLLDEPLGALDLKLRRQMQVELKQLQREVGTTFIYVTHDQEEALALSDWIAVMDKGRVLQVGRGRDIYERPYSRFVADFIGEANIIEAVVDTPGDPIALTIGSQLVFAIAVEGGRLAKGDRLTLAIRPERLVLAATPPNTRNAVRGRLADKVFVGSSFVAYVDVGIGLPLVVRGQERTVFDRLEAGQPVYAGWGIDDGIALRE